MQTMPGKLLYTLTWITPWHYHSGEVLCTLHAKVLEEYQRELQPGAVLVLRQVHTCTCT